MNPENCGDMACAPYIYPPPIFAKYDCIHHDIGTLTNGASGLIWADGFLPDDIAIIGGGGLMFYHRNWANAIKVIADRCKTTIIWGTGSNKTAEMDYDISKFALFSMRDWKNRPQGVDWCPCVSCLMPGLSQKRPIKRRIGMLMHYENHIHTDVRAELGIKDAITNQYSADTILRYIAESEVMFTNTYHGAYWSTLMGKKVITPPTSRSCFLNMKYPCTYYDGDIERNIAEAKTYPQALSEARRRNMEFFGKVMAVLEGRKYVPPRVPFLARVGALFIPSREARHSFRDRFYG
jgi:hypothetical protein